MQQDSLDDLKLILTSLWQNLSHSHSIPCESVLKGSINGHLMNKRKYKNDFMKAL